MLDLTEKQSLLQALGQVIYDEVQAVAKPLHDRIAQLEKMLADRPDTAFLRDYVTGALSAREVSHDDGADGKSVCLDDIRAGVAELVHKAVLNLPVPAHPVAGLIDRAGHLHFTYSDGSSRDMGQVVGRDGKDGEPGSKGEPGSNGRDGIDGLGIEQIEFDGERTFRLVNEKIDRSFTIPYPLYQGLWKPGGYVRGDMVTSDSQQFIAMRDTDKEPLTIDSGWRLTCKRGATGGRGPPGPPGKDGAPAPSSDKRP